MEDLGLQALHRRVAGIAVHRMLHVVTALTELPDGTMRRQTREFGSFKSNCRALAEWLKELQVELVVMESTGIYWTDLRLTECRRSREPDGDLLRAARVLRDRNYRCHGSPPPFASSHHRRR